MSRHFVFLSGIILGVYASDLHKTLLNTLPVLWGRPGRFAAYTRSVDISLAFLCAAVFFVILTAKQKSILRLISFPIWTQVLLICLMTNWL